MEMEVKNKSCSTCALICLVPQVLHDVVDFFHFECVIFHYGTETMLNINLNRRFV